MTAPLPDPMSLRLYREEPIPVIVVTGFLGSGKTTFIRRLLTERNLSDTAILVSEFGEVGLDHLLVEAVSETIVLLEGGCLCCAHGGDLAAALRSLLERRELGSVPRFRRVILETSGLADPGPILQSFMVDPLNLSLYSLSTVIAVIDGECGATTLRSYPEAERQLAMADAIFLSKQDGCCGVGLVVVWVGLGLGGGRIWRSFADVPDPLSCLEESRALDARSAKSPIGQHRTRFVSCSRRIEHDLEIASVEAWMGKLLGRVDAILRMKAVLPIAGEDRPAVLHLVGHRAERMIYLAGWPSQRAGAVTLIAEHGQRTVIEGLANQLAAPNATMPAWASVGRQG
jgi:G3E family GTPase